MVKISLTLSTISSVGGEVIMFSTPFDILTPLIMFLRHSIKNIFLRFVGRHTFPLVPGKGNATVELRVMDLDTEQLSEERIVTYINHASQLYNIS